MRLITTIAEMRRFARDCSAGACRLGLVPTMGALHEGHLSLVRRAKSECDKVVVSIFVNPTQFGPAEDLTRYPRDLEGDLAKLNPLAPDAIFAPAAEQMYPIDSFVDVGRLGEVLEGAARPGHFRGVATVVLKLFHITTPHAAYFGQKDFQQCRVIARMLEDFNLDIRLVTCPIVRELDGLAMSSRNAYLSVEDRKTATALYRALQRAESLVRSGESSPGLVLSEMRRVFSTEPGAQLQYAVVVEPEELRPVETIAPGFVALVAARVGPARLIDNVIFRGKE